VGAGEGRVSGVGAARVYQPRVFLVDGVFRAVEAKLGPAVHQRVRVQKLVVEAVLLEGRDVAVCVAGSGLGLVALLDGFDDQAARLEE
jgi:hypothetical protein